jgi:predicted secreted protein
VTAETRKTPAQKRAIMWTALVAGAIALSFYVMTIVSRLS